MESGVVSEATLNKCCQDSYVKNYTLHTSPSKLKCAFTLAEILITLGVIGVVAALTMPTLIQKHQEQVTVTKLKKFYSTFSQAYQMAITENGTIGNWGLNNTAKTDDGNGGRVYTDATKASYEKFFNILGKYMKIIDYETRYEDGDLISVKLADGIEIVALYLGNVDCQGNDYCGDFYVTTGNKKVYDPLEEEKYVFSFVMDSQKIYPVGYDDANFNRCKNHTNLTSCTAWVLYKGNMDYLRCPDELSWNGKTKCD